MIEAHTTNESVRTIPPLVESPFSRWPSNSTMRHLFCLLAAFAFAGCDPPIASVQPLPMYQSEFSEDVSQIEVYEACTLDVTAGTSHLIVPEDTEIYHSQKGGHDVTLFVKKSLTSSIPNDDRLRSVSCLDSRSIECVEKGASLMLRPVDVAPLPDELAIAMKYRLVVPPQRDFEILTSPHREGSSGESNGERNVIQLDFKRVSLFEYMAVPSNGRNP